MGRHCECEVAEPYERKTAPTGIFCKKCDGRLASCWDDLADAIDGVRGKHE